MSRTQAELFALIRHTAPGWFWAEIADAEAVAWGWAKMLAELEGDLEAHLTATGITTATGRDLKLHALDHGLLPTTGETDTRLRARIGSQLQVRAVTRPGLLALLGEILAGAVYIRARRRDGPYYDRGYFLGRRYYVPSDRDDLGFDVYCEPQADPNAYASALSALEAAGGACIPFGLVVMNG